MNSITLNISDTRQALKYGYIALPNVTAEFKPELQANIARLEAHLKALCAARKSNHSQVKQ
jgi:hypothetical protein